jgi:hypothetical protein
MASLVGGSSFHRAARFAVKARTFNKNDGAAG